MCQYPICRLAVMKHLGICDWCGQLIRPERIALAPRLLRLFGVAVCQLCGQTTGRRAEVRR